MNQLGFKHVLIVVVVTLLVIALGITSYISIAQLTKLTTNDLIHTIKTSSQYETHNIEKYISDNSRPIVELASLYEQYDYQTSHEKYMEFAARIAGVYKITLGFDDGRSYVSIASSSTFPNGIGRTEKYDPRTRPWYQLGKKVNSLALSDVFFTKEGAPILGAVQPIKNGVLLADVRLDHLQKTLEGVNVIPGAVSMIVDDNGLVLASTADYAQIRSYIQDMEDFSDVSANLLKRESTVVEQPIEGLPSFVFSTQINLMGSDKWYLINAIDKKTALATVNKVSWQLVVWSAVIAIIFVVILVVVLNHIYRPVIALKELVLSLSRGDGDLTQRLNVSSKDDLGEIAQGINLFIESLHNMMLEVKKVTGNLSDGVINLRSHSDNNTQILDKHQLETNQVVTAMDELGTTAELVAQNASEAAQFTQEANHSGKASKATIINAQHSLKQLMSEVDSASQSVTKMSDETKDISSILSVIGSIADQTNLLALNAAIEAARAGEQGRGFAVVAEEVRALAARTQDSTGEIESALAKLQSGAGSVVASIGSTKKTSEKTVDEAVGIADSLEVMSGYVTKINDLSIQISTSADEQNVVIQSISQNMNRIHTMVDKLTENGGTVHGEIDHIAGINNQLSAIVNKFKLNQANPLSE